MFSKFAKQLSVYLGSSIAFSIALLLIVIWLLMGPFFDFTEPWQLFINTITTVITFLMIFLLQNTQNRDTIAIHLKLDEIIRAMQGTHNELLKIEELSDEELKNLLNRYEALAEQVRSRIKNGEEDTGNPQV